MLFIKPSPHRAMACWDDETNKSSAVCDVASRKQIRCHYYNNSACPAGNAYNVVDSVCTVLQEGDPELSMRACVGVESIDSQAIRLAELTERLPKRQAIGT
jgi:hypothetical protein